jgi:hypothetical protein
LEHEALEAEAGLMDAGLDGIGEEAVVFGHGKGDLEPDVEYEGLALLLDGAVVDDNLKLIDRAHGESP